MFDCTVHTLLVERRATGVDPLDDDPVRPELLLLDRALPGLMLLALDRVDLASDRLEAREFGLVFGEEEFLDRLGVREYGLNEHTSFDRRGEQLPGLDLLGDL